MTHIRAYKRVDHRVNIEQTTIKRDWMNNTSDKHAYKCFPVSLSNSLGFSISFMDDIEFVWDGISDNTPDHVKFIRGEEYCSASRGNATINFHSDLKFKTEKNISIMSIVPPNFFIDGAMPFTTLMSTSFYHDTFPIAWKITRPNVNILIPAGTPVATLIPISLQDLSKFELDIYDQIFDEKEEIERQNKLIEWEKITKEQGGFTNFYRDAVNYKGEKIGEHELKTLSMKVNDFTTKSR